MNAMQSLLDISSNQIGGQFCRERFFSTIGKTAFTHQLAELLAAKNGFFAFGSALHVYPFDVTHEGIHLAAWNAPDGWRGAFGSLDRADIYFAQDIFGSQYCWSDGAICLFNPETGDLQRIADNIESWCCEILNDYNYLTGYPVAARWQERNGALPVGKRLLPKKLFVVGGGYDDENFIMVNAEEGLRYRADIAQQIKDLPDGSQIRIVPFQPG